METLTNTAPPEQLVIEQPEATYTYQLQEAADTDVSQSHSEAPEHIDGGLSATELERFEEIAANNPELQDFAREATAPAAQYEFPEPPDVITDEAMSAMLSWRLNNASCHLDAVLEAMGDAGKQREWLQLKLEIAAGQAASLSSENVDLVIRLEDRTDALMKSVGGGTAYTEA